MKLEKKAIKLAEKKIKNKQYDEVEQICEQLLKIQNQSVEALYLLSIAKGKLDKKQEYQNCIDKILQISKNNYEAQNTIGLSYLHCGELDKAMECFKKLTTIEPENPIGWCNLGNQFRAIKNHTLAIQNLTKASKLSNHKNLGVLINLAGCYAENLNLKKSIKILKKAIKINKNFHAAHVDLGCCYYLMGKFKKAWKHYQHRFYNFDHLIYKIKDFDKKKKWNGKQIQDGKTILFFCEQGFGDTINFIRFVNHFKEKFPKVKTKILVNNDLFGLISDNFDDVIKNIEEHNYWCSIMDIPHYLKISKEEIKKTFTPYIKPNKKCDYSKFEKVIKIGICWAGNPQHARDEDRSCHLSYFKEIYKVPQSKLFSLQKDLRARMWPLSKEPIDLANCSDLKMIDMSRFMNSWEDTAAIIDGLDVVISVDTSVLHLAGAMGKKTYALLSFLPDWRWEIEGSETYWYPSMKLFRQKNKNDWISVFEEIKKEINMNI